MNGTKCELGEQILHNVFLLVFTSFTCSSHISFRTVRKNLKLTDCLWIDRSPLVEQLHQNKKDQGFILGRPSIFKPFLQPLKLL